MSELGKLVPKKIRSKKCLKTENQYQNDACEQKPLARKETGVQQQN